MTQIEGCTVYYTDGNVDGDTNVLFKDNGWVRIGTGPTYAFVPGRRIERIEYTRGGTE